MQMLCVCCCVLPQVVLVLVLVVSWAWAAQDGRPSSGVCNQVAPHILGSQQLQGCWMSDTGVPLPLLLLLQEHLLHHEAPAGEVMLLECCQGLAAPLSHQQT
jgi:hypothetical protein